MAAHVALMAALGSGAGCSSESQDVTLAGDAASLGSVRMELRVAGVDVTSATAVVSGPDGFATQTHDIDVSSESGVISVFVGSLPVGRGYSVTLTAGPCTGSAPFQVIANQITVVPVALSCGEPSSDPAVERGAAQIVGTFPVPAAPSCAPIAKIVAAPSVQKGDGPITRIRLQLQSPDTVASITWSSSSRNGGAGTIGELSGAKDTEVTFDCSATGSLSVLAEVTAQQGQGTCVVQGRVGIECQQQQGTPQVRCGDGAVNQPSEQCDGPVLPPSAPAGSTCSNTCTLVAPPLCGDGIIGTGEACDGSQLPASAPAGSTCSNQCVIVPPQLPPSGCAACVAENCVDQRAVVDASLTSVDPILDCVLGANWQSGERVAAGSCSNGDLLTCYCGSVSGQDCANASPATLNGQCVAQILLGTGCVTSSCVAPIFLNPTNANGKAMQYTQCQQDSCYEHCFNL